MTLTDSACRGCYHCDDAQDLRLLIAYHERKAAQATESTTRALHLWAAGEVLAFSLRGDE